MVHTIPLLLVVIVPFSVHAGVFSSLALALQDPPPQKVEYSTAYDAQSVPLLRAATNIDPNPAKGGGDIIIEDGALVPGGEISDDDSMVNTRTGNGEISVYVVREADTLSQIADMFDVSANTILWANEIKKASLIRPGDALVILPITGISHVVKKGDTISTIAKKYEGDVEEILSYNQLASADDVSIGDTIVIPGGAVEQVTVTTKSSTPTRTSGGAAVATGGGSSGYINPVPGAVRSQGIHGYNGVDLAAPNGTPVRAAASGDVIVSKSSGWNGGYGQYIVVKHDNGTQTLYAHLSSNNVGVGQSVSVGQVIGGVGNTGRSTGNHVHFEVRGARNPF
jgi:LysM repeat protein